MSAMGVLRYLTLKYTLYCPKKTKELLVRIAVFNMTWYKIETNSVINRINQALKNHINILL